MPLPSDFSPQTPAVDVRPDKPEEACGVFAVFSPKDDVATLTYFGLYALQHRGQESAGIATFDHGSINVHKDMGLVSQVFDEDVLQNLTGQWAIGHTRYSTTGSSRVANAQPAILSTRLGDMALAHNGNVVNAGKLREKLLKREHTLLTTTDTEVLALLMADAVNDGKDWIAAAIDACQQCEGAFSLTVATPEGILAIRDPNGIRPLVMGYFGDEHPHDGAGQYVVSSETCGLDIVNAHYFRDVQPGELVWISESGLKSVQWAEPERRLCIFEMVYFARPDSIYHGESLYSYRKRLGNILAEESPADVDLIMPVPDSGIPAAIGFAETSGIPYAEGLIKNRYVGRTFIQPTQMMREAGIRIKLNPLRDVLQGKRILLVDDSIVRGTTSGKIVKALRDAGATEVHMRISSPPVTHPCFYGIDTDSQDQLIAATKSVKEIEAKITVDSLAYLSWQGMLNATQQDTGTFCSACFTGDYPVAIPEMFKRSKLMLEKTPIEA
ncbi:amidophosphoribosyltransferase [Leptothoe kymatousa]|uniref:Amidophosphoribosyltransferase n=1 Tax=Leptothoe kymatousa TAU-MAC 1615 TaxID=2364775 RepID=A0ABS5Y160_9CYAN|nr:amidophosphoribosyltransferase [Leptothoe kymatousa]MBT9311174.1 amidophosphoribosyltransferase [Leptothoe kymatousa TAU-MAC 1615]